jgi:hypothetical protein
MMRRLGNAILRKPIIAEALATEGINVNRDESSKSKPELTIDGFKLVTYNDKPERKVKRISKRIV